MSSLIRALLGRCPACGRGRLFVGLYRIPERCPHCKVRHERHPGTWMLAAGLAVGFTMTLACGLTVGLYLGGVSLTAAEPWIVLGCMMAMLLAHRVFKALTAGVLHLIGLVTRDPARDGNVLYLARILEERADREAG